MAFHVALHKRYTPNGKKLVHGETTLSLTVRRKQVPATRSHQFLQCCHVCALTRRASGNKRNSLTPLLCKSSSCRSLGTLLVQTQTLKARPKSILCKLVKIARNISQRDGVYRVYHENGSFQVEIDYMQRTHGQLKKPKDSIDSLWMSFGSGVKAS